MIGSKKLKVRKKLAAQITAALSKRGTRLLAKRGKLRVRITLELTSETKKKTKRYVRKTKVTLRKT